MCDGPSPACSLFSHDPHVLRLPFFLKKKFYFLNILMCCKCKATLATNRVDDNNIWRGIGISGLSLHTCGFLIFYFLSSHTLTHLVSSIVVPFLNGRLLGSIHTYIHILLLFMHIGPSLSADSYMKRGKCPMLSISKQSSTYIHPPPSPILLW